MLEATKQHRQATKTHIMLNHDLNDDSFSTRLLKILAESGGESASFMPLPQQWLEYWNDADSVAGNLRKVEHWLQRARQQNA
jgi:hypothetical protein